MTKWVYAFGDGKAEGRADMRNLLGGKGANLAEMSNLGLPVPPTHIMLAYLAATVAVALVPTPGGIGSVEAALIVALVAAGGPVALATAVVLAYRIITVWVPLVPGALTLGALVRFKVI